MLCFCNRQGCTRFKRDDSLEAACLIHELRSILHFPFLGAYSLPMARPKRSDEAGVIYHVLNRGNAKQTIFRKRQDYEAFESIILDALKKSSCELFAYQLMPNHWHFVLRPAVHGGMGDLIRWISLTHTMRYHSHYQTIGQGHLYQGRFKSFPVQNDSHFLNVCRYVERNAARAGLVDRAEDWRYGSLHRRVFSCERWSTSLAKWPIERPANWLLRVNSEQSDTDLTAIRKSLRCGSPYGEEQWKKTRRRGVHCK